MILKEKVWLRTRLTKNTFHRLKWKNDVQINRIIRTHIKKSNTIKSLGCASSFLIPYHLIMVMEKSFEIWLHFEHRSMDLMPISFFFSAWLLDRWLGLYWQFEMMLSLYNLPLLALLPSLIFPTLHWRRVMDCHIFDESNYKFFLYLVVPIF